MSLTATIYKNAAQTAPCCRNCINFVRRFGSYKVYSTHHKGTICSILGKTTGSVCLFYRSKEEAN